MRSKVLRLKPSISPGSQRFLAAVSLTPLTAWPTEILAYAKECNMVNLPPIPPIKFTGIDRSKYCQFHRNHGHDIGEYYMLKQEIDAIIQSGKLKDFID